LNKTDRVFTPDGWGTIIDCGKYFYLVQLDSGSEIYYSAEELHADDKHKAVPLL
jgi:hypothetical protein